MPTLPLNYQSNKESKEARTERQHLNSILDVPLEVAYQILPPSPIQKPRVTSSFNEDRNLPRIYWVLPRPKRSLWGSLRTEFFLILHFYRCRPSLVHLLEYSNHFKTSPLAVSDQFNDWKISATCGKIVKVIKKRRRRRKAF